MNIILSVLLFGSLTIIAAQSSQDCDEVTARLSEAQKQLSDWPEINRYREANSKIVDPEKGENRVVFIGDSITDIWDENGFGGFFPGKPYINRGIGGQTTPQILLRFRRDVLDLHPKVVVILAGTNDLSGNTGPMTIEESIGNLISMAELATSNGVKVVLSSVLPVSDRVSRSDGSKFIQTSSRPPAKILELNRLIRKYAEEKGYTYLDYFREMVAAEGHILDGITFDGLHPNKSGYRIMNRLAENAIRTSLNSRK